jgi:hypothetical protein
MKVCVASCQPARYKVNILADYRTEYGLDVVVMVKTWLKPDRKARGNVTPSSHFAMEMYETNKTKFICEAELYSDPMSLV